MITTALATEDRADDMAATLADTYFDQESRLMWEFNRLQALDQPGLYPRTGATATLPRWKRRLMSDRNHAWIPVIEAAAATGAGAGGLWRAAPVGRERRAEPSGAGRLAPSRPCHDLP